MIKNYFLVILILAVVFTGCSEAVQMNNEDGIEAVVSEETNVSDENSSFFYYYFGEKIYLQQITNKICLKFEPNASKEELLALIGSDASLQLTSDNYPYFLDEGSPLRIAILETKDGKQIPSSTIELFKTRDEVVSVEYLYSSQSEMCIVITDEFVVKLKSTTSDVQLQNLLKQHNCMLGDENMFVKNQFKLYVPKTSKMNAMQMSNLFFETGLFELCEPNFINVNAFF